MIELLAVSTGWLYFFGVTLLLLAGFILGTIYGQGIEQQAIAEVIKLKALARQDERAVVDWLKARVERFM